MLKSVKRIVEGKHSATKVAWYKFYEKPATAPALERYYEEQNAGWIIDLMICFLERTLLKADVSLGVSKAKYVANFSAVRRDFKKANPFEMFPRYQGSYEYHRYQSFMYQVTFTDSGVDRVCTMIIKKRAGKNDDMYVFFPFPAYYKTHTEVDRVIRTILVHIEDEWKTDHGKSLHIHPHFRFPDELKGSNVYSIYFLVLMQKYTYESIRNIFQNRDMLSLTRHKAIAVYRAIGKLMGYCVSTIAAKRDENAKRAYMTFMGKNAKTELPMTRDNFNLLRAWFAECSFRHPSQISWLNNLLPVVPTRSQSLLEALKDRPELAERMKNFLPLADHPVGKIELYV